MNKTTAFSLLLTSALSLTATAELKLDAVTDRVDALYKAGEIATFTITALDDGKPVDGEVKLIFSKDGFEPQQPQVLTLKEGKVSVTGKLDEPGFLSLKALMGDTKAQAAAAYDPGQLKPSMAVPDDFDAFWKMQKDKLAAVPMNPRLTPKTDDDKVNKANLELFDIQLDCVGAPVSGYFVRPKNAAKRSLPAILALHGGGVRSSRIDTEWASMEGGMLYLDINAHGIPNGQPPEFYTALQKNELQDYSTRGRTNREEVYFLGMFLRLIRAIDFLAAQPEWDGKTIILYGSSQGGFQALAGAALDSRVTFFCAGVPAGCDHTGFAANRIAGWPKLVTITPDAKPEPTSLEAARYFDGVNFATRIKTRGAALTVGFIDISCPPTTVYTAYNALSVPKKIHFDTLADHTNTSAAIKFMVTAVREHIREMKEVKKAN